MVIIKEVDRIIIDSERGRNLFHAKFINLSYRIRGRVPRTQINRKAKNIVFNTKGISVKIPKGIIPKKKTEVNKLMVRILVYSAIKIRANLPALNSTLNPDTNSDSPSDRSKGVRFVSAKVVINQIINKGGSRNEIEDHWEEVIRIRLKERRIIKALSKISAILTS